MDPLKFGPGDDGAKLKRDGEIISNMFILFHVGEDLSNVLLVTGFVGNVRLILRNANDNESSAVMKKLPIVFFFDNDQFI